MKGTIFVDYKMLNSKDNSSLENELNNLLASGVDEILVKPVFMTDGFEARKLRERLSLFEGRFCKIEFGIPVLGTPESINDFAEILIHEIGFNSEYEYLLVGHGSKGGANEEYSKLSDVLHSKVFSNVEVACLTGQGDIYSYLEKVQKKFQLSGKKSIQLYPLLINSGTHITKDIFGTEDEAEKDEKSVLQLLLKNGFNVIKNIVPLKSFESFKARYMNDSNPLSSFSS